MVIAGIGYIVALWDTESFELTGIGGLMLIAGVMTVVLANA